MNSGDVGWVMDKKRTVKRKDVLALLRVARVVKEWINLYNDGPLPNFASWREAEKEIEAALKEVEHLLEVDK